jgi:hypothetical protein
VDHDGEGSDQRTGFQGPNVVERLDCIQYVLTHQKPVNVYFGSSSIAAHSFLTLLRSYPLIICYTFTRTFANALHCHAFFS